MSGNLPEPRGDNAGRRTPPDPDQIRQVVRIAAVVLAVALILVFVVDNAGTVRFSFVFFSADISLLVLLLLTFAVGAGAGILADRLLWRRLVGRGRGRG